MFKIISKSKYNGLVSQNKVKEHRIEILERENKRMEKALSLICTLAPVPETHKYDKISNAIIGVIILASKGMSKEDIQELYHKYKIPRNSSK